MPWAWWGREPPDLPLRHAVRILGQAGRIEELVYPELGAGQAAPPLDRALRAHQQAHRNMGRTDRLLLGTAVYGLARNRQPLRAAAPDLIPGEGQLLLLALLDALASDPGDVGHLPGGVAPWLAALDRLARLREGWIERLEAGAAAPLATAPARCREAAAMLFSVPGWWLDAGPWATVGEAVRELARLRRPQKLILRAQAHRVTRDAAVKELRGLGIPAVPTPRSPWGLRIEGRHNVLTAEPYRRGDLEVQDEGSQLVACLCDPKPSEKVLDLCAGGGGKALALASALGGRGLVVAHDADPRRLEDTRRRARRAGLGNIRVAPEPELVQSLGPYDLVLVDAPCTSSGTLRRNPDAAWRWERNRLEELVALQASILDGAAERVRPGGYLVYVTCSLLEPENGAQVASFLTRHPDFAPAPLGDRTGHAPLADVPGAQAGVLRLPADLHRYDGDGFFLARLRRNG